MNVVMSLDIVGASRVVKYVLSVVVGDGCCCSVVMMVLLVVECFFEFFDSKRLMSIGNMFDGVVCVNISVVVLRDFKFLLFNFGSIVCVIVVSVFEFKFDFFCCMIFMSMCNVFIFVFFEFLL